MNTQKYKHVLMAKANELRHSQISKDEIAIDLNLQPRLESEALGQMRRAQFRHPRLEPRRRAAGCPVSPSAFDTSAPERADSWRAATSRRRWAGGSPLCRGPRRRA